MKRNHCALLAAGLAALLSGSCALQPRPPAERSSTFDLKRSELDVQSLVMKMADDYTIALAEAVRPIVKNTESDPRAREAAQWMQRNGTGSAIDIAVGSNPDAALLDILVLVSLHRWSFNAHWGEIGIPERYVHSTVERLELAEASAWKSASTVLSDDQRRRLRSLIDSWIAAHPERLTVAFVRFEEFIDFRHDQSSKTRDNAEGLLREVSEATASVDSARLLGERALWYAARYPFVLGQQTEATLYKLADQPEYRSAIETIESLKQLSNSITARVDSLDRDLNAQQERFFAKLTAARETAVTQAFDRFSKERKDFFDDLQTRDGVLRDSLLELRGTIGTSADLAKELTGTVNAIDRVVARFDPEARADGKPLDMKNVRDAAIEAGNAAAKLTVLLERTNELASSEMWEQRLSRLDRATTGLIDRAFWRGLLLVLAMIAGLALVRLIPQRTRAVKRQDGGTGQGDEGAARRSRSG
jgi:hypothetical protein